VVAVRSLREVERREALLLRDVVLGWVVAMVGVVVARHRERVATG
jgi:hypothetical protein